MPIKDTDARIADLENERIVYIHAMERSTLLVKALNAIIRDDARKRVRDRKKHRDLLGIVREWRVFLQNGMKKKLRDAGFDIENEPDTDPVESFHHEKGE